MTEIIFPFDTQKLFVKCVKNQIFPRNDFKKRVVLIKIAKKFKFNKIYSEQQVNTTIKQYFKDFALIRRELVNFGYMSRDPIKGEFRLLKQTLTKEEIERNTLLKRHAKAFLQ